MPALEACRYIDIRAAANAGGDAQPAAPVPARPGPACEEWIWCECGRAVPHCQATIRWDSAPVGCRLCDRCQRDRLPSDPWCGCNCSACSRFKKLRSSASPKLSTITIGCGGGSGANDTGCVHPPGSEASQPAPDCFFTSGCDGASGANDTGCVHSSGSEASQPAPDWFVLEPLTGNEKDDDPETLAIFMRQFGLHDSSADASEPAVPAPKRRPGSSAFSIRP